MSAQVDSNPNCDVPALWLAHKNELRNFISKRVHDQDLTNDILQEVLLKVYSFCLSKSGVNNVRSWLFQIAQNTIVDHYRKQARFATEAETPDIPEEEEDTAFQDALNYIKPMLAFLPKEYAVPLEMADIEGMKQADIAEKLGLSLTGAKSRIQRARQMLKEEFITCCHFETDANGHVVSFEIKESCQPLQVLKKEFQK